MHQGNFLAYFNSKKAKILSHQSPTHNSQAPSEQYSSPGQTNQSHINLDSFTKSFVPAKHQTQRQFDLNTFGGNPIPEQSFKQYQSIKQKQNNNKRTHRRTSTLVQPKQNLPNNTPKNDFLQQVFKISPKTLLNHDQNQDSLQINIRPFQSKFIRQLNFKENERFRKNRKKIHINMEKENFDQLEFRQKKTLKPHNRKQMHEMWHNGIKIISQFKNEIIHGQTQIHYPNGAIFIGKYEQGVRIFGSFDFNNGYVYWGGFLGDKFAGEGNITLPNGKVYSGEWSGNQLVGNVEIKYPSGDVYYGEVKDFKKHGKGYLFFKTGQKFVGEFQNGNITGKGQYFINEQCIGRGIWKNGQLVTSIAQDDKFQLFTENKSYMSSKKSIQPLSNKAINSVQVKEQEDELIMDGVDDEPSNIHVRNNRKTISIKEIESQNYYKTKQVPRANSPNDKQQLKNRRESEKSKMKTFSKDGQKTEHQSHGNKQPLREDVKQNSNLPHKNPKQAKISFCDVDSPRDNSIRNISSYQSSTSKNLIQTQEIMDLCNDFPIPYRQKADGGQQTGFTTSDGSQESNSSLIRHTGRFKSIGSIVNSKNSTN